MKKDMADSVAATAEVEGQDVVGGKVFDSAIIGGGPAGLSAAIYLGRMRRSVIVVDDDKGRSTWHQVNRNYLGFVDGVHAFKLRQIGETQAKQYGVEFFYACADAAGYAGDGQDRVFTVTTPKGLVMSRTLILCMGVSDSFPEFDGSIECIGKSMFWCIICDGYEAIGKRIVVLGHNDRAASLALQLKVFTENVTLVSWDKPFDITEEKLGTLHAHDIRTHDTGCELFSCSSGQIETIKLDSGEILETEMVFVAQWIEPNTKLAQDLGLYLDHHGYIMADAQQVTNVEGVFAAGDITRQNNHQVTSAVHEGGMAAAAANYYLYEDWQKEG